MKYDAGKRLQQFARGEISSDVFAAEMLEYLDSPEYRRIRAARAAEDLKRGRAGRERLLELIQGATEQGFDVQTRTVPLKDGMDSLMVLIDGGGTGFPSSFDAGMVEEEFEDILQDARDRRAAHGGRSIHDHAAVEVGLDEHARVMIELARKKRA